MQNNCPTCKGLHTLTRYTYMYSNITNSKKRPVSIFLFFRKTIQMFHSQLSLADYLVSKLDVLKAH